MAHEEVVVPMKSGPQEAPAAATRFDMFFICALIAQAGLAVLFGCCTTYGDDTFNSSVSDVGKYMNFYVDVTTMIFVGFGFLMVFGQKQGYTALVMTFFISVFVVQWSLLTLGFAELVYDGHFQRILLTTPRLIDAMFTAGSVMISFGAIIGKVSPQQLLFIAFWDVIIYSINFIVIFKYLKIADVGGSITIHLFGAYYGLALTAVLSPKGEEADKRYLPGVEATYSSDLFSMVGTLFLWIMWPSFNGALALQQGQLMAVINTLLSLCASAFTTTILSRFFRGDNKFHMVDLQNATLAGGVAMGTMADTPLNPGVSIAIGMAAGFISTLGFNYIQPRLERLGLRDSCGVHNLHGMPGLLGGLVSVIATNEYFTQGTYGSAYTTTFPNGPMQAKMQLAGIGIAFGFAIVGGVLTGLLTRLLFKPLAPSQLFTDKPFFHMPHDFRDFDEEQTVMHLSVSASRQELFADTKEPSQSSDGEGVGGIEMVVRGALPIPSSPRATPVPEPTPRTSEMRNLVEVTEDE